ncbi:MAG: tRNA adenosine deaminase-associated protein [Actinobacteria bacterium]|nr:tRNA adenosine deaminase-associated protein [Actinomycetota bacterium]MBI3686427.1 tRNA adenosine deaminase-associated protein [Actinomycetota bacterium]
MSYFAAVVARTNGRWSARELDLARAETIDDLTELVRDTTAEASVSVLFIEQDDEYVGIVRLDAEIDDPRVFLSNSGAGAEYPLAGILADVLVEEDDEMDGEPVGDLDLVGDLGTPARDLIALIEHEGILPADVINTVCERAGCLDALEGLRGA